MTANCTVCLEPLPEKARFCPGCGRPVPSQPADDPFGIAAEAERRHLTAMFCDLVGSTAMSTHMDAEDFSDIVNQYLARVVAIVREWGGDVESYHGDGMLFRFGWPEAHDDDTERALRASLDVIDAVAEHDALEVRIGVHSGLVIVGEMGGVDRKAVMSLGENMNLAARLQGEAVPGTLVTSAHTLSLVEGIFVTEPLGARSLKGIPEPVEVHRVVQPSGVRSRFEATRSRWRSFVGRADELDILVERWRHVATGEGTSVLITGEPGVGKSRLAHQLREVLSGVPHSWIDCGCSSFTQMSVLWPVVQLIEQALNIDATSTPEVRLERLRRGLDTVGVTVPDALGLIAGLLAVPGVPLPPMSPERRRERTIEVLAAWVVALSRLQPLVLLVEDLHWCDPTSIDLLNRLLDQVGDAALLLLMTARPEFEEPWEADAPVTHLGLQPFNDDEVRRLVISLAGDRELPAAVVERIVESSDGFPLFAEEVGQAVLESGLLVAVNNHWELTGPLTDLDIPETLQGSLMARLDRLGPAKGIAQVAAVIGRTFAFDLLAEVSETDPVLLAEHLQRLVDTELVFEVRNQNSTQYVFKHVLIQEIAYESLLRRTRRVVHDRIAQSLKVRIEQGIVEAAEIIARHFEAAGSIAEAAGYYQFAARDAMERSGYLEAIAFLRHGISLIDTEPASTNRDELELDMRLALGSAVMATNSYADAEVETTYARARELCEGMGNDARVGLALAGLSIFYTNRGEVAVGAELAERVLEIARVHDDDTLELLGRVQMALPRSYMGFPAETVENSFRALAVYDPVRHRDLTQNFGTDHGVAANVFAGWGHLMLGYLDVGLEHFNQAVNLAESLGQPINLVFALAFRATCHWERGESSAVVTDARAGRELAAEQGFRFWAAVASVWELAEEAVLAGDAAALPKVLEAGLVAAESGNRGGSTTVMARVAEAAQAAGDIKTAGEIVDMALQLSADTGQPWWDAALHRMRAELLFNGGTEGFAAKGAAERWDAAEEEWLLALAAAAERATPVHGLRAAASYSQLLTRTGRTEQAVALIDDWYGRCPEGQGTPVLVTAKAVLDQLTTSPAARRA